MNELKQFFIYITYFRIFMDIWDIIFGSLIIFGALKWRKGLISSIAIQWGIYLGIILGFLLYNSLNIPIAVILSPIIGAIVFPILTYKIPAVNRFVLGFIVVMKFLYLVTTYLCKQGNMEFMNAICYPIIIGTISGIVFMFLRKLSVLPFVLGCVFIGSSQAASTLAKYTNQFIFGITHDPSLLIDPIDFIFALFKIELTDGWTLLFMVILMGIGIPLQLSFVKKQGYSYDTPIIAFETDDPQMHGKIVS